MTIQSIVESSVSGDNTVGHVASASVMGGAFASIVIWFFQLAHIIPPPEVQAAFGVIGSVAASWVMQKVAN